MWTAATWEIPDSVFDLRYSTQFFDGRSNTTEGKGSMNVIVIVLLVVAVVFWLSQFVSLMNMRDEDFPGRYDKPIWAMTLILANILGAIAFWIWKPLFNIRFRKGKRFSEPVDEVGDKGEAKPE